MPDSLKYELCIYLGELLYRHEHEFDWINKRRLEYKIKAVNTLLENETIGFTEEAN